VTKRTGRSGIQEKKAASTYATLMSGAGASARMVIRGKISSEKQMRKKMLRNKDKRDRRSFQLGGRAVSMSRQGNRKGASTSNRRDRDQNKAFRDAGEESRSCGGIGLLRRGTSSILTLDDRLTQKPSPTGCINRGQYSVPLKFRRVPG